MRGAWWLVAGLVVACAGRSERATGSGSVGGGPASGAGTGATAAGGASGGVGGSMPVTGGSAGTGGSISVDGVAGELSMADTPQCLQPMDAGTCRGAFQRWAFDPATLRCVSFLYGGCDGNDNRFDSVDACQAACTDTLPAGCDETVTTGRPAQCPCTIDAQCGTFCSNPVWTTLGICQPAPAGYCGAPCCTEGHCLCRVDGRGGCGV